MALWPWIDRKFSFDFPPEKMPDLIERLRGTPVRVEALVAGLADDVLARSDGRGWSIKQNIGHVTLTHDLFAKRIDQFLAGEAELVAADMSNRRTNETDLNAVGGRALLTDLRDTRAGFVARLESLDRSDWARTAHHPRLKQPMRLVDMAYFVAEHDDYHLARISELLGQFRKA